MFYRGLKIEPTRQDLLQIIIDRLISVMRLFRHHPVPGMPVLSPPMAHVLFTVAMHDGGVSVKDLSEIIGVTPGAITQFVNTLVEKGLVLREEDTSDRRIVRLKIAQLANDQMEKLRQDSLASAIRIFETINDDELRQLIDILSKIDTSSLQKIPGPAQPPVEMP